MSGFFSNANVTRMYCMFVWNFCVLAFTIFYASEGSMGKQFLNGIVDKSAIDSQSAGLPIEVDWY